jgi:hypothetical protein
MALVGEHELRASCPLVPAASRILAYGSGTGRSALDPLRRGGRLTAIFARGPST